MDIFRPALNERVLRRAYRRLLEGLDDDVDLSKRWLLEVRNVKLRREDGSLDDGNVRCSQGVC